MFNHAEHRGRDLPGWGSQCRDERLQETTDEAVGVPLGHHEVEKRQDEEAVDEETHDDRHSVHSQLAANLSQILHLHNLPCD